MNPFVNRVRIGLAALVATWCVATSLIVHAQDFEREKRWADEVVPGLVVGDAVRIKAASNREFLALYTEPIKPNPALPAIVLHLAVALVLGPPVWLVGRWLRGQEARAR